MKKRELLFGAVIGLAFTVAVVAQQQPAKGADSHLGTWELISIKYGEATDFSDYSKERRRLKLINPTHFIWVDFGADSKLVSVSAGGPYTLEDDVYTETIEFAGEGMEPYLGKQQEFRIKVEGDKLIQSGQLSDGMRIEEIWRRVK